MKRGLPGHVRERANKSGITYEARIPDPIRKTDAGYPFVHTRSFDSRAEADEWLAKRRLAYYGSGATPSSARDMTLNEACDVWLNRLKLEGDKNDGPVRAGTHRLYRENLLRYVKRTGLPRKTEAERKIESEKWAVVLKDVTDIGSRLVSTLEAQELESWALELSSVKGRGLAKRVLRDVKAVLARAAIKLNRPDVWRGVKLRKIRHEDRGVAIILQTEQAQAIMDAALHLRDFGFVRGEDGQQLLPSEEQGLEERIKNSNAGTRKKAWARWAPLLWLLFRAGVRIGEGLAFKWRDLDQDGKRIRVERTVSDGGKAIEEAKTTAGKRWIELDDEAMAMLSAYRSWCEEPRSKIDTRPRRRTDDDAYMFGTRGGARWDNQQNFRRAWDHLFACLDLLHDDGRSWASPHDARHWHASLLFEQDIPLEVISERLGHSTTTITAEIYVHLLGDRSKRDREAANRLGAALSSLSAA